MATADLSIGAPPAPEVENEPAPLDDHLVDELDDLEPAGPVDESLVRGLLKSMGGAAGWIVGDPDVPDHWRFTERELDELTPPLTRIINRRPHLRRAVVRGDEAMVALVLAGYAGRNVTLARKAKEARGEVEREAGPAEGDARAGAQEPPRWSGPGGGNGGRVPGPATGGLG